MSPRLIPASYILMLKSQNAATLNANEKVNATEVASVEPNNLEEQSMSENATEVASVEQRERARDLENKPTTIKAHINGEEQTILVAHTEYGMRHEKKMDRALETADKKMLLTPRYHFCKPEIFWKEGYNLFDNNCEPIEQGTDNVLVICDTPETSERIFIEDFLEDIEVHDFESVADYARHIGETTLVSRMPNKVEEMGIAVLATGDEAVKAVYEFAVENHISYTTALGYLDAEMKPILLKTMMKGVMPKNVFTLGRSKEKAEELFKAARHYCPLKI